MNSASHGQTAEASRKMTAEECAIMVLIKSGRSREQAEQMMGRHTVFGALANNVRTFNDLELQRKCISNRDHFIAELTKYPPVNGTVIPDGHVLGLVFEAVRTGNIPRDLESSLDTNRAVEAA